MTIDHEWTEWLACRKREDVRAPAKRPRRHVRRHADWILELAVMLVLVALLPRSEKRE
jgi:hypothetical protein